MALGLTQPLAEMSTRNISRRGKGGRCLGLTNLLTSCTDCLEIWEPQPPGSLGMSRPVMGLLYLLLCSCLWYQGVITFLLRLRFYCPMSNRVTPRPSGTDGVHMSVLRHKFPNFVLLMDLRMLGAVALDSRGYVTPVMN
jgi:hypothetical protein